MKYLEGLESCQAVPDLNLFTTTINTAITGTNSNHNRLQTSCPLLLTRRTHSVLEALKDLVTIHQEKGK